jgi:excisionase family DNA binding protein
MTQTKTRTRSAPRKPAKTKIGVTIPEPEVLTLVEAAAYLRVAREEVLRMIVAEGLPGRQFGTECRFLRTALQAWLSEFPKKNGLLAQLGKAKDDPYLQEMLDGIYARRGRPEVEAAAG